jgi:L-arabinose isomerase
VAPGPITLVNLVGQKSTYRLAVFESSALPTELVFPGNPVRFELPGPKTQFLEWVARHGMGHHWVIAQGHHRRAIEHLGDLLKVRVVGWGE